MTRTAALWLLSPIAAGIAVAAWFVMLAPGPERLEGPPRAIPVRTVTATAEAIRPTARGWGNARAAETWSAVSEVNGQIVYRHPGLESGLLIAAGTTVLEIDPADYALAIRQAEADLTALVAEGAQLDTEEANTRSILALEEDRLALSERELARTRELVARGTAPQVRADEQERATLQIRRTVAELRNGLALIPSQRDRIAAQTARTEAALDRARRDLANTRITAPFDLRVRTVEVGRFQYVNVGQLLVTGDDIARAEVTAQIPFDAFPRLIGAGHDGRTDALTALREGPATRVDAELRLVSDPTQVWQGRVSRVEGALDPQARSIQVVVTVDDPYKDAAPPLRLPLIPNMYLEVTLSGSALAPQVIVPEAAVHQGDRVYLVDSEGRLEVRPVTVAFRQEGRAVIAEGLVPGETVVLDDLAPAIPGLLLTPVEMRP